MTDKVVAFSTCSSPDEARRLATALVEARLAACVNIIPNVQSIYTWQGKVEDSAEFLLIIKTRRELLDAVKQRLSELHSYDVPELIALPIIDGLPAYLDWLEVATKPVP